MTKINHIFDKLIEFDFVDNVLSRPQVTGAKNPLAPKRQSERLKEKLQHGGDESIDPQAEDTLNFADSDLEEPRSVEFAQADGQWPNAPSLPAAAEQSSALIAPPAAPLPQSLISQMSPMSLSLGAVGSATLAVAALVTDSAVPRASV
jgi:hypothetical protein